MSTENEIINGTIEIKDAGVSQAGFGVPMLVATHTFWSERVRAFSDFNELTVAPFNVPTNHPVYLMARALKSQQPSPEVFKIGKRTGAGLAADLAAIRAADDDWYSFSIDTATEADILAGAAWAEGQRVLFMPTINDADSLVVDDDADDVGAQLKTAGYKRTVPMYHDKATTQFAGTAWAGRIMPKPPGSMNWANKSLAGVDVMKLDDTQRQALRDRNLNYYVAIKGLGFTLDGRSSGGRFADITHGMDWFEVRMQERIIGLMANTDKIGFTDKHIELFRAQAEAQILEGIGAEVIDGAQPWSVTVPSVAQVNPNDKIARVLNGMKFKFVLQGAVNKVNYIGTVLVAG